MKKLKRGTSITSVKKKEPKENGFFLEYQSFFGKDFKETEIVKKASIIPITKWLSFNIDNIKICSKLDIYNKSFRLDYDCARFLLYYNIHFDNKYIKYLKRVEKDFSFLYEHFKTRYNISSREIDSIYPLLISLIKSNKNFCLDIASEFGLEPKECKLLGLEQKEIKVEKLKGPTSLSLAGFMSIQK